MQYWQKNGGIFYASGKVLMGGAGGVCRWLRLNQTKIFSSDIIKIMQILSIPTTLLFKSSRKSSHLTLNINQFQDDLVSAEPMLPLHYYIQRNPCKTSSFAFPVSRSNHPINITLFKLNNSCKHWSQLKVQDKVLAIIMEPISSPLRYTETFRYNIFLSSFVCWFLTLTPRH